jgi:hypothetical protein
MFYETLHLKIYEKNIFELSTHDVDNNYLLLK